MAKTSFVDGGDKGSGSFEAGGKSSLKAKSSFTDGGKAGRSSIDKKSSLDKKVSFTGGGKASIESDGGGRKSKKSSTGSGNKKVKRLSLNADGTEKSDDDSDSDSNGTTPRDNDDDDDDSDTDVSELAKGIFSALNKYIKKRSKQLLKLFVNYGPPYNGKPFNPELINECCKPTMDYRKLHKILSKRSDPNMPDPTDLYYTPMHWVARNLHFIAMKMLKKAGANINVYTEVGNTINAVDWFND
jgi:hypothetical protein